LREAHHGRRDLLEVIAVEARLLAAGQPLDRSVRAVLVAQRRDRLGDQAA
jgi:hypothetical protein